MPTPIPKNRNAIALNFANSDLSRFEDDLKRIAASSNGTPAPPASPPQPSTCDTSPESSIGCSRTPAGVPWRRSSLPRFGRKVGSFAPVSVAWGEPMRFDGLPRNAKGYREASVEIQREIRRLFDFLADVHALGRPSVALPPA